MKELNLPLAIDQSNEVPVHSNQEPSEQSHLTDLNEVKLKNLAHRKKAQYGIQAVYLSHLSLKLNHLVNME